MQVNLCERRLPGVRLCFQRQEYCFLETLVRKNRGGDKI